MQAPDAAFIAFCAVGALLAVLALAAFSRGRDPMVLLVAYYWYFAFGPVVNYLFGKQIYFGTVTEYIPNASLMYLLAIVALVLPALVIRRRTPVDLKRVMRSGESFFSIDVICIGVIALQVIFLILVFANEGNVFAVRKTAKIAILGSGLHYGFLLLQAYVASMYFIAQRSRQTQIFYRCFFAGYIAYCLVMGERDFFFVIASILAIQVFVGRINPRPLHVLGGFLGIYLATFLKAQAAGQPVTLLGALNQGNLLFVDTFTQSLIPRYFNHMNGYTYVNTVFSLLPSFIHEQNFALLVWFKDLYAPGGNSGYGFSLEAEAYVNFGLRGVPIVFFVLACGLRSVWMKVDRGPFWTFLSILLMYQTMYGIRNDSLQLLKATAYGLVFFLGAWLLSDLCRPFYRDKSEEPGSVIGVSKLQPQVRIDPRRVPAHHFNT